MSEKQENMSIDITQTRPIVGDNGKPILLAGGLTLRKGSKFLIGSSADPVVPIEVMYDVNTNKIFLDMLPKEIREDYKDIGFSLEDNG